MKKISLSILASFFGLLQAFSQTATDSTSYTARKLHVDEVNLVSAYYSQDGDNSAVTGGIGTEKLTDFANTIELKLVKRDRKDRLHTFGLSMGIDNYTSASSDKIDPSTVSSPSYSDTRYYPSLDWTVQHEKKHFTAGLSASFSTEFDYKSYGLGLHATKTSKDNNRELGVKLQAYFDTWKVIYPVELRPAGHFSGKDRDGADYSPRNSYSASFSLSQVVNKRLQIALLLDFVDQQGLLATDYQRVYFTDNSERVENLPDTRFKVPLGIRANYFLGDRVVVISYYRYYTDDWGVKAHTLNLELPVKINPYFSVSPFYRFYTQTASDYFAPYGTHAATDVYYTSDYDLSKFSSQFFGAGFRLSPQKGVFGIKHWHTVELRYGHYVRNTGLHSDIISLNAGFK